jgi:hypothetical protein
MAWAPFLASRVLYPPVPALLPLTAVPVRTGLAPLKVTPPLMSATVLYNRPSPVRSAVIGRTAPVLVLTTGSTTATVLVTGFMIRLLTMALLVTNAGFDTITVVVKLWHMKNPGNQKPNQKAGYGTQAYRYA